MTAGQTVPAVGSGTCQHCARILALRPDGLIATHYLRRHNADRDIRKRCPGSRQQPRRTQA